VISKAALLPPRVAPADQYGPDKSYEQIRPRYRCSPRRFRRTNIPAVDYPNSKGRALVRCCAVGPPARRAVPQGRALITKLKSPERAGAKGGAYDRRRVRPGSTTPTLQFGLSLYLAADDQCT